MNLPWTLLLLISSFPLLSCEMSRRDSDHDLINTELLPEWFGSSLAKRNGLINRIAEDAWDGTPHSSWNWLVYWTSSFKLRCRDVLNTFGGYKESDTHFAISCRDRSNESHHDLIKLFCEIFIFLHLYRKKIISWPPVRQPFTLWNSSHDQAPVRQIFPKLKTHPDIQLVSKLTPRKVQHQESHPRKKVLLISFPVVFSSNANILGSQIWRLQCENNNIKTSYLSQAPQVVPTIPSSCTAPPHFSASPPT